MIHTVGTLSGGVSSWGACRRWIDTHGPDGMILLFTDVGGDGTNPYVGEDPDTLRFRDEAAANLGVPLINLRDGRDIWDVFREKRWIGNSQLAHCSWELKTKPAREWMDANALSSARVIVGIDVTASTACQPSKNAGHPMRPSRRWPNGSRRCGNHSCGGS